jgi:hypothetical protein
VIGYGARDQGCGDRIAVRHRLPAPPVWFSVRDAGVLGSLARKTAEVKLPFRAMVRDWLEPAKPLAVSITIQGAGKHGASVSAAAGRTARQTWTRNVVMFGCPEIAAHNVCVASTPAAAWAAAPLPAIPAARRGGGEKAFPRLARMMIAPWTWT